MNALQKAQARLKELMAELGVYEAKDLLTADDLAVMDTKMKEIEAQEATITVLKAAEALRARQTVPAGEEIPAAGRSVGRGDNGDPDGTIPAMPAQKMTPDQTVSLIAAATMKGKAHGISALKIMADEGYAQFALDLAGQMKRIGKAVDTNTVDVLIPEIISNQIIELLRPETTFFQGGPRRIQFTSGKFKAPRGATGASASYVGEGAKKPVTEPTFDSIDMSSKKLAAIVLITREAKDWSLANIDAYIRDDLRAAMAQAIDTSAYFGTGAGDSPTGILATDGIPTFDAADFVNSTFAPTLAEVDAIASRLILSMTMANIGAAQTWAWLMSYRTLEFLKNMRVGDNDGMYAYPDLQQNPPRWKGFRVLVTNQVPVNGGATTDETTLSLIDFRHVLYGEEGGIEVKTSDQATVDVNGTLVHLWQQNMYGILTEHRHDFGLRHLAAVAKMNHIRFGALEAAESP